MKTIIPLTTLAAVVLTASAAMAGETTYAPSKEVVAPAPTLYGTGWYFGLQAGINAYQNYGDSPEFSIGGNDISIDNNQAIGFVGGVKVGYVFGTGLVRPAIEADLYYNGIRGDLDVNGAGANVNADANLNSGAFLANFLLRFNFDRFQPYLGGGVGGYVAQADDVDVTVNGQDFDADGGSNSGFAWQLIGGADYYWTQKMSTFLEYKFLNYEDAGFGGDGIQQHIVVLGLRWHF